MSDSDVLQSALNFLGLQPKQLTSLLAKEGTHSRSTTLRWLSGEIRVPVSIKLWLKQRVLEAIPRAQKPAKPKIVVISGHNGGVGTSPFAVTLAHFLTDFGLRSKVYHVKRFPKDTLWSKPSRLSVPIPRDRQQSEYGYLPELQKILYRAGSGEMDLDCLVIDLPRGVEDTEHGNAIFQAADAGIVLARCKHLTHGWDQPPWQLERMLAAGIPAKVLIKFEMTTLSQLNRLSVEDDRSDPKWFNGNFFEHFLIDNCAGAESIDPTTLFKLMDPPFYERSGLLMQACQKVTTETLTMLGLAYVEELLCVTSSNDLPTLETIMEELTPNWVEPMTSSNK
jgi:hypothetical protein